MDYVNQAKSRGGCSSPLSTPPGYATVCKSIIHRPETSHTRQACNLDEASQRQQKGACNYLGAIKIQIQIAEVSILGMRASIRDLHDAIKCMCIWHVSVPHAVQCNYASSLQTLIHGKNKSDYFRRSKLLENIITFLQRTLNQLWAGLYWSIFKPLIFLTLTKGVIQTGLIILLSLFTLP